MTTYYLEMSDDGSSDESREIESDSLEAAVEQVPAEAADWVADGYWGDDGAAVGVTWWLYSDADHATEIEDGSLTIDVEPNHDALISAAGGDTECDHDWSAEGEGGCDENPGVWSTGGTSLTFSTHCRKCGLQRTEYSTGMQRNPGEHDTVKYEQPTDWCADCQHETCEC